MRERKEYLLSILASNSTDKPKISKREEKHLKTDLLIHGKLENFRK